jgi:NHL repeat
MKRSPWVAVLASGAAVAVAVTLAGPAGLAGATPGAGRPGLPAGYISTVAGGPGGPGPATSVSLEQVAGCFGMQVAGGRLFVNGGGAERAVNVRTGGLETVAAKLLQSGGFSGYAGPIEMMEQGPCSATVDSYGNLVVADFGVQIVAAKSGRFYGQKMTAGHVYRLMRSGNCDGSPYGLACAADVAIDHFGNVIASFSSNAGRHPLPAGINVAPARSGTFYGLRMKVGHIYHLVSGGGAQVAGDLAGNLLVAGDGQNQVGVIAGRTGRFYGRQMKAGKLYDIAGTGAAGFSGDGGPAVRAKLSGPHGVALDSAGNVIIGDTGNSRVRVVAERTGRFYGLAMKAGDIYTVIGNASPAARALPVTATAVAVDAAGNLLTFDGTLVRVLAARAGSFYGKQMRAGHIYTVAGNASGHPGDGGPATSAQFQYLYGLALDSAGNLVQTADFRIRVVPTSSGTFYGQKMTAGDVYTVAGDGSTAFSGDRGPATRAGMWPEAVAVDGAGNLVIADQVNNRVRVVAAKSGMFYGQKMTAGDVYTVAGDGSAGSSGDGGPAVNAATSSPDGVAVDGAGNLLIAEAIDGLVRVIATRTGTFYGQSMTAGDIYTVAGGGTGAGALNDGIPATQAELALPAGLTTDSNGNLVIAEALNGQVRVVAVSTGTFYGQHMTSGDIYTVAGDADLAGSFSGDGGPAIKAAFASPGPFGVAVDGNGNLVIADEFNGRVRVVAVKTGTFYGQKMTAGDIYTVAGGGTTGLGDGGPATKAEISPYWIAINANGDLVVTDQGNGRIRLIAP